MIYLKQFLAPERIAFLDSANKAEALAALIEMSRSEENISDFDRFRKEVVQREAVLTTGIGQGVAIPHVKSDSVRKFFITVGILRQGVNWDSMDEKPVYLAFLIGGPKDHESYLQILAKLTLIIRNAEKRKAVVAAESREQVLEQFAGI
jgi:fructose-specific phosphotransferase system IIA component